MAASAPRAPLCGDLPAGLRRLEGPPCGACLDHHHAQAVGDGVVQLARDPRALVGDRQPRVLLALRLELRVAQPQLLDGLAPASDEVAEQPDGTADDPDDDQPDGVDRGRGAGFAGREDEDDHDGDRDHGQRQRRQRPAPIHVRRDRVHRDQHAEADAGRWSRERGEDRREHGGGEHRHRPPPPERDREGRRQREGVGQDVRVAATGRGGHEPQGEQGDDREDHGQRHVKACLVHPPQPIDDGLGDHPPTVAGRPCRGVPPRYDGSSSRGGNRRQPQGPLRGVVWLL